MSRYATRSRVVGRPVRRKRPRFAAVNIRPHEGRASAAVLRGRGVRRGIAHIVRSRSAIVGEQALHLDSQLAFHVEDLGTLFAGKHGRSQAFFTVASGAAHAMNEILRDVR